MKGGITISKSNNIDYEKLDLQFLRGELPVKLYCALNNKSALYNLELQRKEMRKKMLPQLEVETQKQAIHAEVKRQLDATVSSAVKDILKGLR